MGSKTAVGFQKKARHTPAARKSSKHATAADSDSDMQESITVSPPEKPAALARFPVSPWTLQEEHWLFVHVTGHYPHDFLRGDRCWREVASRLAELEGFTERTPEDLEGKWGEFVRRGVTIRFFESAGSHWEPRELELEATVGKDIDTVTIPVEEVDAPAKTNDNPRHSRYSEDQVQWLVNWVNTNHVPGARKSWKRCAVEFKKKFGIERSKIGLNLKYEEMEKKGMTSRRKNSESEMISPVDFRDSSGNGDAPQGYNIEEHSAETESQSMKGFAAFRKKSPQAGLNAPAVKPESSSRLTIPSSPPSNVQELSLSQTPQPPSQQSQSGKRDTPGRYTREQLNWLLDYVEQTFEGIKMNMFDWELVADAFEEEWGVKRKPGALAQKLGKLVGKKEKARKEKVKKRISGGQTPGESGGGNNGNGNGCGDVDMVEEEALEEGEIRQ
ncbi:hypothetical protein RUND412_002898 [Rhizina undulata]